jgi:lambda repressor-like predicted transcriptional regulator
MNSARFPNNASDMSPNELWSAMIRAGVSQQSIADQLGIRRQTVHTVIKGRAVSHRIRSAIASALGMDLKRIWPSTYLYGGGPRNPGRPSVQ